MRSRFKRAPVAPTNLEVNQHFPQPNRARLLPILIERRRLQGENEALRVQVAAHLRSLGEETRKREPLERSALGRAVSAAKHLLKTSHRRRHVDIHPRLLLPRLNTYVQAGHVGQVYFFAMTSPMRRRSRHLTGGATERWIADTLSAMLRGHPGGKKRPPLLGLLPTGMNSKSLRRSFGSLLLRSGKSTAEVVAAMGNTEDVVRQHFARILGCEVDVDF